MKIATKMIWEELIEILKTIFKKIEFEIEFL